MSEAIRYCLYCRNNRPADTFTKVFDRRTGRLVNHKCSVCVKHGKRPQAARDARGRQRAEELRSVSSQKQQELKRAREEQQLNKKREEKA